MTTLWLDIGNSRLKWWLSTDLGAAPRARGTETHAGAPAEAVRRVLDQWGSEPFPARAWLADVTGPAHRAAIDGALAAHGLPCERAVVTPGLLGLVPAYAEPARLGIDRFLMMLALRAESPDTAFGVAAAGTALTFDAVDAAGRHLGGVIGPGLTAAGQAVRATTRFQVAPPENLAYDDTLGQDTEACVRQGAFHACAGLLDRLGARVPRRVLCGGDALTLLPHLKDPWEHRPELILDGLRAWAKSLSSEDVARPGATPPQ